MQFLAIKNAMWGHASSLHDLARSSLTDQWRKSEWLQNFGLREALRVLIVFLCSEAFIVIGLFEVFYFSTQPTNSL
jgi:hypothetical protein